MKVLSIFGGPRKKGNTARVLGWVEAELIGLGREVERVNVDENHVAGCLGCANCQQYPDDPGWVQRDDALSIFEKMISSEIILFYFLLYCWGFRAQLKLLIDRHFCLVTGYGAGQPQSLIQGHTTALLVTCAYPVENNADLIIENFQRLSTYLLARPVGKLIVPFCATPDALD